MGDSDLEWLQRWRQGDALAFEALVRRWQEPISRLLGRLVTPRDTVPDLCQEVFLRVHRGLGSFRAEATIRTWLYRIAVNVARDAGRRRRLDAISLSDHDLADGRMDAATHCAVGETTLLVARAVEELPGPLREALVLRHYEQLNFEQMARVTGVPASTLKSRFSAALLRLRVRLEALGLGPEEWT